MQIDNVERRESWPRLTPQQVDDALDAERAAANAEAYEHHINAACAAIQHTPFALVTPAYIGQVLDTLACKAQEAHLPELCESLEVLSCEVTP
ncbi:hypothetical protein [Hydrogenophaga sp. 2FB]|uniref:hypothetical protein n=1 Tax=Hydrogenophaga sp. 2FB TaxID=2502187 RepID=UPI0010F58682|nr:hypothetical protein [Hydrogenophaga sp. 2FB]